MSRLQKKCLIASGGMHLLLALILIVSAGFKSAPEAPEEVTLLKIIPLKAIDGNFSGGGNPSVKLPEQKPVQATPPKAKETEPEPVKTPAEKIVNSVPKEITKPKPDLTAKIVEKNLPKKSETQIKIDTSKPIQRNSADTKTALPNAAKIAADQKARRTAVANAANAILKNSSKATIVDMPGQGGGEAYADYRSIVYTLYYENWIAPDDLADDESATTARIVVARDGNVISFSIEKKSGRIALDQSVEAVLHRVQKLPPFPSSTKDSQRTFIIKFNLKAKQSIG